MAHKYLILREKSFNSRTREGCDLSQALWEVVETVSIHAPGRGATQSREQMGKIQTFQFTHPGGVRRAPR